jgi:hypothetical protein
MSNQEHYKFEAQVKAHIKTMPEKVLRERMADFIDIATVDTVKLLATFLGPSPK